MTSEAFDRRGIAYFYWIVMWAVNAVLLAVFASGSATLRTIAIGGWGVLALPILYFALWSLVGYYRDAQDLKATNADWVPRWRLWAVAHLIFSPMIVGPVYYWRRRAKTQ